MTRPALAATLAFVFALTLVACAPQRRGSPSDPGRGEGEGEGPPPAEGEGEGPPPAEGEGEGPHLVDAGTPAEGEGEEGEGEGGADDLEAYCAALAPDTGGGDEVHHPNPCDDNGGCDEEWGCKLDPESPGEYACSPNWADRGEDEYCATAADCQPGLTCTGNRCVRFCFEDKHCPGDRECGPGSLKDENETFLTETCGQGGGGCNPLCSDQHCGRGRGCYRRASPDSPVELVCEVPAEDAPEGAGSCGIPDTDQYNPAKCQPGWVCDGMGPDPQCRKVCNMEWGEIDNPGCEEGQACQAGAVVHRDFTELGYCSD